LILGSKATSDTFPYIEKNNMFSTIEHEATTSKINEEQLFYCQQRGFNEDETVGIIVNGFCKNVLQRLPKEFSAEARKLLEIKLEGTIG
jgi:Fe-S cluster assembly protein SufB